MGLLDKLKAKRWAGGGDHPASAANFDDLQAAADAEGGVVHDEAGAAHHHAGGRTLDLNASPAAAEDSSIITEAAPSEMAQDFGDTRGRPSQLGGMGAPASATPLPLIGDKPLDQQQRILGGVLLAGLLLLVITVALALTAARRNATQVGATGQALMQSQRLAKAVSQALIGSAQAFPEVKEAVTVLAKNVRALKNSDDDISSAPGAVQELLEPLMPLVDRA
ncbi:MAG: type IV pili methyl-accepting chemotaxis transducer N-terminal domain-containing protein, partial [Burkholderiales bacterium]|nr:type IV pili methyl-accepting chemotaxis transducer N-terminal domain-containing protein [Burkholderiales bacterium]